MKKNMRKVAALGLCVALGATMLTACGGSKGKSASGGKTELNFGIWDENQRPAMEKMVKAYEKENSDVKINIQLTPYKGGEYWTKLEAAASGGKAPDVFWLNVLHLDSYVEGGILDDLTDKIKDSDIKDSYSETLVNNYVRDKKNYAVPKDFDTNAMWYNKEIFDKCGVPYPTDDMSYDDLVATAKALKDSGKLGDGVYPFACPVDFQTWYYQTVYANGGYILSDDKKSTDDGKYAMGVVSGTHAFTVSEWNRLIARPVSNGLYFPNGESEPYTADNVNINAPENVWAAQWWQDFILKDKAAKLVTDKKDSREMFWNGDVPFNMDGPWFVGMCKERDESLMDDIGIIPQFDVVYDGTTYKPNPTNYPLVTMISKNCKHPKEAYAFLEWMTTDEAQKIIADCGMIPSNTDYSTSDEYIQNHELEHKIVEFMQNNYTDLVADPNISQLGEISQIMLDAAQKMFSEQAADVQEEMDSAQKQVEEVMSRDAE